VTAEHDRGHACDASIVAGPPSHVLDTMASYQAAGVDEFIVRDDKTNPLPIARDTLELFWAEIATPATLTAATDPEAVYGLQKARNPSRRIPECTLMPPTARDSA
jgi:hypothetical protein